MSARPDRTADETTAHSAVGGPATSVAPAGEPRQKIGRYALLQQIGVGGMGVVFAAYDGVLDRQVAIKLVRADRTDPVSQARILREGRALARLSHPNVVAVHEVSTSAGQLFLVMEYVKGITLRRWAAAARPVGEIVDMFLQAGRGLAAAHERGLVHRDFKPENVLVGEDGRARVVDFGLVSDPARGGEGEAGDETLDEPELSRTGAAAGTPAYMAPEQFFGRGADARSDQFSFCVALYEALCGERPFAGETALALQTAARGGVLRPPRRAAPEWLIAVLRRGLSPEPGDRWPTMDALLAELARDPAAARRRRLRLAGLMVAVAALVAASVLGVGELRRHWQQEQREDEAAGQLAAVNARIAAARARGDAGAAARSFEDFTTDPRFRETAAFARAWLDEADRRRGDGELEAASAAFARAFVHARAPGHALAALDGLAGVFRAQHRWGALTEVLAELARVDPAASMTPARRWLAVEAALGRRDVAAALQQLPEGTDRARGLLTRLAGGARETAFDHVTGVYGLDGRIDFEGDGAPDLLLVRDDPAGLRHDVVRRDASLTWRAGFSSSAPALRELRRLRPLLPGADGRTLFYGSGAGGPASRGMILRGTDAGTLEPIYTWPESMPGGVAAGDLDGDGAAEVYVGTIGDSRRIFEVVRGADDAPGIRLPVAAGDEPESDINGLAIDDLDGDGRAELIVGSGPWRAYDVRVYRREPDGLLHLVDRAVLGAVFGVATLRRGDARVIAAAHTENFASSVMFPPERPFGEPPGIYLLGLRDGRLTREATLAFPPAAGATTFFADVFPGVDLDGDGREDLAVELPRDLTRNTLHYLQEPDGGFTEVLLGQATFLGATQLDDDPAPESLYALGPRYDAGRLWIVGAGEERLPVGTLPEVVASGHVRADIWEGPWRRAEELRGMGLHAGAAEAFEEIARDAADPALRGQAALAAARAREADGAFEAAAEGFARAGARAELAEEAARGEYRARLRLGDYTAARAALERLLGAPALPDRADLERARDGLEAAGAREVVEFAGPLAPAWTIVDPLALRRDSAGASLEVDVSAAGVLAELEVEVTSESVELVVDATLEAMEWGASLQVALVPADREDPSLRVEMVASGGGRQIRRIYFCDFGPRRVCVRSDEVPVPTTNVERVSMRAASLPLLGEQACALARRGEESDWDVSRDDVAPHELRPGRHRLVLRAVGPGEPARLRATIHAITLVGARVVEAGVEPPDPTQRLARALVEGDHAEAQALARAPLAASPTVRVWTADMALRSGRQAAAQAELAALLRSDEPAIVAGLTTLLRGEPELYAPAMWSAAPREFLALFVRAWRVAVQQHIDEPRVPRELLAVLGPADLAGLAGPGASDDDVELAVTLLTWRALAERRVRRGEAAREDLLRALERTRGQGEARRDLLIELASLAAERGDVAGARRFAEQALAVAVNRRITGDMLRARPELARALEPAP